MPTSPNGALGSLDYKKEERHALAIKSCEAPPKFGTPERQKLIDEIHEYMLSKASPVPQLSPSQASKEHPTNGDGEA
ncbi:ubiquitin-conjugating enzyme 32 [Hibiscus trionum]|uniref:Ubiquitin-conjugating enzyme 32 n=1 Tax=Hibiscus trionum TaxID=183268 RepID=A0A9W7MLU4_HIBTR|nr:ubiquitin-conjugating enzyme 32 [Hibiscus trionum]